MRIVYVARHDRGNSNDDEGAIAFALGQLGHEVVKLQESPALDRIEHDGDLLLFHKWCSRAALLTTPMPKVFWYFDRVVDEEMPHRSARRRRWMAQVMPLVDLGFCTDGDWSARHADKLVWLPQGFDQRLKPMASSSPAGLLVVATVQGCGRSRLAWFLRLRELRPDLRHVQGVYRERLAEEVAAAKLVMAPNHPVSYRYWSNRVYLMLGLGAVLLHPWSEGLATQYSSTALTMYDDRTEMVQAIERLLNTSVDEERLIRQAAIDETMRHHTYRHRCEQLLQTIKERT